MARWVAVCRSWGVALGGPGPGRGRRALAAAAAAAAAGLAGCGTDQAITDRAMIHNALDVIYASAGVIDPALDHYRESIRYEEKAGNRYRAGESRFAAALALDSVGRFAAALALDSVGRFDEALPYAQAALRDFETYGSGATQNIGKTRRLIATIQQYQAAGPGQ